jgi:GDPmannose 4,6-dehydratase
MKAAFITGVTGQDGSYLSELLLEKKYSVYGLARYCSERKHERIEHLKTHPEFHLIEGDLTDTARINSIINSFEHYDLIEVYNLGAQSHVKHSFSQPEYTANVDALGTLRLLEAIRQTNSTLKFRFYQAGTSEMFGKIQDPIQNEKTPFYPRSPYGVAKVYSYWITKNYRESYGIFAVTGILFNHESERRGSEFVTRKVTMGLAEWLKNQTPIELGNLDAKRDWGHAQDYVEAMWLMLQRPTPDDFVVATGQTHSIRDFIEVACDQLGIKIRWNGTGEDETCTDLATGNVIVRINPEFYRPSEVDILVGDATKARDVLNWRPKIDFTELVKRMVLSDCK